MKNISLTCLPSKIILDIAIPDDYGKKLWNDCFKKKETVRWSEFRAAFGELMEWSKKHFKTGAQSSPSVFLDPLSFSLSPPPPSRRRLPT